MLLIFPHERFFLVILFVTYSITFPIDYGNTNYNDIPTLAISHVYRDKNLQCSEIWISKYRQDTIIKLLIKSL